MECEGASAKNDCSAFLLSNLPCSEDNFCDILHNSDKREWCDTPVQKVGAAYVHVPLVMMPVVTLFTADNELVC